MKKILWTLVAVAMVVVAALFVLPVFEGETTQSQIFHRVGVAEGGG